MKYVEVLVNGQQHVKTTLYSRYDDSYHDVDIPHE